MNESGTEGSKVPVGQGGGSASGENGNRYNNGANGSAKKGDTKV